VQYKERTLFIMEDASLNQETPLTQSEQNRREFVKTAGKLAVYTPPIMMLLMKPTTSAIAASAGLPETSAPNVTNDGSIHDGGSTQGNGSTQSNGSTQGNGSTQAPHHHGFWLWRLLGLSD
jgi:hypothetical protein